MDFKCKKCGGELVMETRTIGICSYCKSRQTVSALPEEKQIDLLQRAEAFRLNSDFDQAVSILESMVEKGYEDAELHWLLALCRYGIIYVEDPTTHKQLPTFYRLQKQSFLADPDYLAAVKLAGVAEQQLYNEQAREISRIQQQINQYAINGEQYDVFISYKETDKYGNRTKDSEIAHQIYNALTKENIRVFFSHITLENMLGEDYESVIYSALMSSKMMLLIMTSLENAEATWVKNEWKRYLSLIGYDDSKRLIPVLYGMRPEEIPTELSHLKLQALDFTRLGAIEDLVHNTKKILKIEAKQPSKSTPDENAEFLRTAFFDLAEQKYDQAEMCFKAILIRNPNNARGHFGCFASEKKIPIPAEKGLVEYYKQLLAKQDESQENALKSIIEVFNSYSYDFHYRQAYLYGDHEYKNLLDTIHKEIEDLLIAKIDEIAAKTSTAEEHFQASCLYGLFPDNPIAKQKTAEHLKIKNTAEAKDQYEILMSKADHAVTFRDCMDVANLLETINFQDSSLHAKELRKRGCQLGYPLALKTAAAATSEADHQKAADIFEELSKLNYKDSSRRMKGEQRIVSDLRIKAAKKHAEMYPNPEGYLAAADMLKSIDTKVARKEEENFKQLAIKAAKSKRGVFSPKANALKAASIVCTLLSVLLIAIWVALILSGKITDILRQAGRANANEAENFVFVGLVGLAFGLVYGFIVHFCWKKRLLCILFLIATILFPIIYAMLGHSFFSFTTSASSVWLVEDYVKYLPFLFGCLMIPAFFAAWFVAFAKWQSMLKAVTWIVGLFVLTMLVVQIDFGSWGVSLETYHRSLSEAMQIAFFPIFCIIGALLFGFGGRLTKISRLMDLLFVAAVYSLVFWGPAFSWKTNIYSNWGMSEQFFFGLLLLPSLLVFFIPRKNK